MSATSASRSGGFGSSTTILAALLLVYLLLGSVSSCTPCLQDNKCKNDSDCMPGWLCRSYGGFHCPDACAFFSCNDDDWPCIDDLFCYTHPDEHPFPSFAERHIGNDDGQGVCYYPPGDPRIPDYGDMEMDP
jgi:hypothetical protein